MASTALKLSSIVDSDGRSQVIIRLTIDPHCRPCVPTHIFINPKYFKPVRKNKNGNGYVRDIVPPRRGKNNLVFVEEVRHKRDLVNDIRKRLETISEALIADTHTTASKASVMEAFKLTREDNILCMAYDQLVSLIAKRKEESKHRKQSLQELSEIFLSKRDITLGRKDSYRVLFRAMLRYQGYIRKTKKGYEDFTMDIDTIDKVTIDDFFIYLLKEQELAEKNPNLFTELIAETGSHQIDARGSNTIVYHKKRLKCFWKWLIDHDLTTNNPVKGLKTGTAVYGTPCFIDVDERNLIANANLPMFWDRRQLAIASGEEEKVKELPLSTLLVQRDIFIFQCLTGCRYGDLIKLTSANIINDGTELSYMAAKTRRTKGISVKLPLLKWAQDLIKKYWGKDKEGRLFPFISGQKYNQALKQIFRLCGLTRYVQVRDSITGLEKEIRICDVVSSHMARRTFIGNLYNKVKDPCIICSMSGHIEDSKAFARYREISMDIKRETIKTIA